MTAADPLTVQRYRSCTILPVPASKTPKRPTGRPSKLSVTQLADTLVTSDLLGPRVAAAAAGVSTRSVNRWRAGQDVIQATSADLAAYVAAKRLAAASTLSGALEEICQLLTARTRERLLDETPLKGAELLSIGTLSGILIDKVPVLMGTAEPRRFGTSTVRNVTPLSSLLPLPVSVD